MHLGLIGGIGPAATVFYYERIVRAFAAASRPLHLTIAHTSAHTLTRNVAAGRVDEQVTEYRRVTDQLAAAGADVVVITSMGGHFCAKEFATVSPLPMIDGPDAVASYLAQRGLRRVGVLGTRVVMKTRLYGALSELDPITPIGTGLDQVDADYIGMAVAGEATPGQRQRLIDAGQKLVDDQRAEAILLGGTDLNLIYSDDTLTVPVVDSAVAHIDAIVKAALGAS